MTETITVPFARPYISEDEKREVLEVLDSGWLTSGARCKRFEEDFAKYIGQAIEAIAVNSCTAGLHLALEAIGISPGDEVIVPTHTFTATAEVVRYLGADPVFVDVLPQTLCIDPKEIEQAITEKTKAIIPVHYAGLACEMEQILLIAKEHGLKVIEDAAHALPTEYAGDIIGSLKSDATVFSFYANKTITTGEGGMIVTRNADIAKRCRVMRTHGIDRDAFDRFTSIKKETPSWYYQIIAPGFKYNMPDIAAAVGIHQLKQAEKFRRQRERLIHMYKRAFSDLPISLPPDAPNDDRHAWHIFVIHLQTEKLNISRDAFISELNSKGVGTSVHYIPLHMHPYWKKRYKLTNDMFPISTHAFQRIISLPLFPSMTDEQAEYVINTVRNICQEYILGAA